MPMIDVHAIDFERFHRAFFTRDRVDGRGRNPARHALDLIAVSCATAQ